MLEAFLSEKYVEKNYTRDFVIASVITTISLFLAALLFTTNASQVAVALITISIVPILLAVYKKEELKEILESKGKRRGSFLEHEGVVRFLLTYFFAVALTSAFWYIVLPAQVSTVMFSTQIGESGGIMESTHSLPTILTTSLTAFFSMFLISLIYGGGTAFVLTWNATNFGLLLGLAVKGALENPAVLLYALPEFTSNHLVGVAGGIISAEIVRRKAYTREVFFVVKHAAYLAVAGLVGLLIAAVLEAGLI